MGEMEVYPPPLHAQFAPGLGWRFHGLHVGEWTWPSLAIVDIAIATLADMPDEFRGDDERVASLLRRKGATVATVPWTADFAWEDFDLVVVRSTWDYSSDRPRFVKWCSRVGDKLENQSDLIIWNSDKRYVDDLIAAGVPTVPTSFVGATDSVPPIDGEVVIKPTVSAGGRNTGRFGPSSKEAAFNLIDRITQDGGEAMIQPYLSNVETKGEKAVVFIDGEISHVLRKGGILQPDEVAPIRSGGLGVAEAMFDPDLVMSARADPAEMDLARGVLDWIGRRFNTVPLTCRVDMIEDDAGDPIVLEVEAVEPYLYLDFAPTAAEILSNAILARAAVRAS